MSHTVNNCTTPACASFNLDGVDMGSKAMTEIMDAEKTQEWAKGIMNADRQILKEYYRLNPANSRQNLYGALSLGLNTQNGFAASDPTVRAKLGEWLKNLNAQFPGVSSYTPELIKQRSVDLKAAADCIGKNTQVLAAAGELMQQDANYLNGLVAGLNQFAAALEVLHTAVCAGPGIKTVSLNIPAQKH